MSTLIGSGVELYDRRKSRPAVPDDEHLRKSKQLEKVENDAGEISKDLNGANR